MQRAPSLSTIEAFLAAAERGSFKAAADRLCLSAPAVTRRIQALERHAGAAEGDRARRHRAYEDLVNESRSMTRCLTWRKIPRTARLRSMATRRHAGDAPSLWGSDQNQIFGARANGGCAQFPAVRRRSCEPATSTRSRRSTSLDNEREAPESCRIASSAELSSCAPNYV